ncbi:zinc transport system permease protein [Oribacterium sp. KHPX15]|uniref:metal ABC transporter permease n=1 Tax=Oribacterium sp. KHPX15 TaxID=1855342 RepID=UPI000894570F|nr:metal ABC transporter permease [Oribacterium sp. KHPX15]SEA73853.1 zinc transport system permease protein [Oribacterium sp. KHPX15]
MEWIAKLQYYMGFPFVKYALIVAVLTALCSSLLGVILVLRRFSYIGDGLSHVAFGALAVASVLKVTNQMVIILPVTIITAVLLLAGGKNKKLTGDSAIAIYSVGALAIGYLLMNTFSTSANISGDVCTTLFGSTSILTLTGEQVTLCIVLSIITVLVFVLFYNRIFMVTFDESFAKASGINTAAYQTLIAVITAMVIVLAMNLVGSLLITALLVFPVLSAMRVFQSFRGVIVYSAVLSIFGAVTGILVSILASTPVGSTIVIFDLILFLIHCGIGSLKGE